MSLFRKKPVVIEARQLTDDSVRRAEIVQWIHQGMHPEANAIAIPSGRGLDIRTLEGVHYASPGDWIIRGVAGEFYPCKPDIFAKTYEPVDEVKP